MDLPIIKVAPTHTVNLEVLDKEVKFRPYTIAHEKVILTSLQSENFSDLINNYTNVMLDCLDTEIDINDLSIVDFINIIIHLRAKSSDEILKLQRKKCSNSECGKAYAFDLDVENSLIYENVDKKTSIFKVTDDLSFELNPTKYLSMKALDGIKDVLDIKLIQIAFSISKIIFEKAIYQNDDPNKLIENILVNLSKQKIEEIIKEIDSLITIRMEINSTCPFCKNEECDKITDFLGFIK